MWEKFLQIWKAKDLRKNILTVLGLLVIFRIAAHIPIGGVDIEALRNFFDSNAMMGMLNIFSGGGMKNFSIVMLGVGPYITSSIIMQLLTMIVPNLEALSKEGEAGHQKINQYTRLLTIPLALVQGYGFLKLLRSQSGLDIMGNISNWQFFVNVLMITAGTVFVMWLGELISERKVGNGISLIILAGIVAGIPGSIQRVIATFDPTQLISLIAFSVIALVTIAGIVILTEGQRNIPVSYARQIRGNRSYGGTNTHLPMKVNQAGMIPIIFAISMLIFPQTIAQLFANAKTAWVATVSNWMVQILQNQLVYGISYFLLVVAFTYFYTSIIFHPHQIAENLQKQGGFIPGIRPGKQTAGYLRGVSNHIMLAGALSLGLIAVLPNILRATTGIVTLTISGASLLIVVAVVIETANQVKSQLMMREYDKF